MCTHTHVYLAIEMETFHRHNGFYAAYCIFYGSPITLSPYPLLKTFKLKIKTTI